MVDIWRYNHFYAITNDNSTVSMKITCSLLIFNLLFTFSLLSQEVSLSVSAPSRVAVGERFRVVFSVNERPTEFHPPAFEGFTILSGPSQSTSSSTQIINNQVTTSLTISYTYVLEALSEGTFSIGPARVVVAGNTHQSASHTVEVSGQASQGAQPTTPGRQAQPQQPPPRGTQPTLPTNQDIFIRAHVSNANPYQSEQVIISYRLYTRIAVARYGIDRLPSFQGFWSENLTPSVQSQPNTEMIDGSQYSVVEIRRVALFPQRSGELTIEPLEVETVVRMRAQQRGGNIFDDFFGGSVFGGFQNIEHTVRSNPVTLRVKPLPSQNRPPTFKGSVGQFEIEARLSANELQVNEATNLEITIRGSGNLRMLENPLVQFPQNLETFDPNISDNIRNERSGVTGSRVFDFLLIPRTPGEFVIPAIPFSFFDPASGAYATKTAGPFSINVSGHADMAADPSSSFMRSDVQSLATDIRFIRTQPTGLVPLGTFFFRSHTFYLLILIPWVLFLIIVIVGRREIRQRRDVALMRHRKAEKSARSRLKKARTHISANDHYGFYDELFKALWGYLSDKFDIPVSRLNKETVADTFSRRSVPAELVEEFFNVINECEFARFAPNTPAGKMDDLYSRAIKNIVLMEKKVKGKRS